MRSKILTLLALSLTLSLLLHSSPCSLVAAQEAGSSSAGGSGSGSGNTGKTASDSLKEGTAAMASGRFSAAISAFDDAIASDPSAYLSYYRRATAELSLGRTSAALADLDTLLRLKPDFAQAHFSRANVLLKEGELQSAKEAIDAYLKLKTGDAKGTELKGKIDAGLSHVKKMNASYDAVMTKGVKKSIDVKNDKALKAKADDCVAAASKILESSPNHLDARNKRADCRLALGELEDAISDWSGIVHLSPSIELLLRLSSLKFYILGDAESTREAGLLHLKACLASDPDNRRCARAHRRLRAIDKALKKAEKFAEGGNWRAVISALKGPKVGGPTIMQDAEAAIKADMGADSSSDSQGSSSASEPLLPASIKDGVERSGILHRLRELHCRAHTELKEHKKASPYCDAILARDAEHPWGLLARGEAALREERWDDAVRDLHKAVEQSEQRGMDSSEARQGMAAKLQKAQRLQKQANTKDYYKVLGVARDADGPTIKKAYRKLAKEHHPDKGGSAEKMAQINEAFDVLSDEEKRQQFDMGVDPNDPMGGAGAGAHHHAGGHPFMFQQGGGAGGNPFASFFQQGGGGGGGSQFFKQQFHQSGQRGQPGGGRFHFEF